MVFKPTGSKRKLSAAEQQGKVSAKPRRNAALLTQETSITGPPSYHAVTVGLKTLRYLRKTINRILNVETLGTLDWGMDS